MEEQNEPCRKTRVVMALDTRPLTTAATPHVVVTRMEGTAVPAGRRYIHPLPDVSGTVHVSTSRSGDNCSIGGSGDSRPGPARQWFIQRVIPMAGHMRCVVPSDLLLLFFSGPK
jgi:hypothetical protein